MKRLKNLLISASFLILLGVSTIAVVQFYGNKPDQPTLEQKIKDLQVKIDNLEQELTALKNEQRAASLAAKETEKRQVIRQKSQDELLTAAVAKTAPSVVSVVISKDVPKLSVVYKNPFGDDPFFKDFNIRVPVYEQSGVEHKQVGAGTGFLISADGYILTNKHVVSDPAADYTVLLFDGNQKNVQVVYLDQTRDIAIVKIEGKFTATVLGDSATLKLGQSVIAIGNALGEYNNSVSVGIISGLNREIVASGIKLSGVIQTDAAINPGNSGGPLLDLNGRVVGINVATVIGASSISFAIPINVVRTITKSVLGR